MSGIKIINVLKDDTLAEILELFRQAPPGEVIFVLPKNGKIFRKEDHFSAFAAEAAGSDKTISVLTSSEDLAVLARKYKFNVMHAGKATKGKKPAAKLASQPDTVLAGAPPPADDDIPDTSKDALDKESRVVVNSDESMAVDTPDEEDEMAGFHVEDETGPVEDADKDVVADDTAELTVAPVAEPVATAAAPVAELDYIDAVWRDKVAAEAPVAMAVRSAPAAKRAPFWKRWSRPSLPRGRHISRKVAAGIMGASAILLAVVVWATTGSASVILAPVSHQLNVQMTVQASDVYTSVDSAFNKIPGQLFEATRSATALVAATGQRDVASKARGKITISNEYSSTPQTLVATTRFATPDGLIFRTLQSATVPGSTVSAGKTVAGSVTVDVIADKPGPDYNVAAGKWIVMAFKERSDAERMDKIFGTSTEPMSGGASGPSKVVTQEDYDKALATAQEQARSQLKEAFDAQGAGMKVLDEAQPVWDEAKATAKPDDAAESVSVTVTGTLKTVAFRQDDLDKLLADVIEQKERLVVLPKQLELAFSEVAFKPDIGTLVFSVNVKGPGYEPLDTDVIRGDIKGKGAVQIRDYFAQKDGIESATVSLSPFWVRKVPTSDSRIKIEVQHDAPVQ